MSLTMFYLLIPTLTLTAAKRDMYPIAIRKDYTSIPAASENLKIILDYIQSKQEFYTSIFSLVYPDTRSKFVDLVSRCVTNQSIVSYKITTNDLSRKYKWQNRIDLTWIFIVNDINILNSFVLEQSHIWKATNQYLMIITAPHIILSQETFQTIWKSYNAYKIIVISIQDNFKCLNKYLPFEKNERNEYGIIRKDCLIDWKSQLYTNFENLNGYPIRVIVFPSMMMNITFNDSMKKPKFSKLDAKAMLLLERVMRARFRIKIYNSMEANEQDPFHRTLQYVENGKSEMIITGFFTHRYEKYRKYEFTVSVYEDKVCLIAPTAGFVPKSYMPIMPFTPDLWTALAIYNVLVSVLWFFIKYYSGSFRRQKTILLPLMRTTRLTLSRQSNFHSPKIHPYVSSCFDLIEMWCYPLREIDSASIAQRALLFGTLFFGLIVTGLYQSCLVSGLSNPFHYPELNTLEDVANSNLTIITKYHNLKENTFTGNTTLDNKLKSKIKVLISNKPTNDIVAFGKRMIAIGRLASIKLDDMSKYYDVDGNELLHIVEECPTTYLLSYVMKLHSPYRERIDELLLRMQEAGLVNLWYKNMIYPSYVAEQKRKMDKDEKRIKLTMEHYSLTFVGLLIGLFFCVIVFLAELYFARGFNR